MHRRTKIQPYPHLNKTRKNEDETREQLTLEDMEKNILFLFCIIY